MGRINRDKCVVDVYEVEPFVNEDYKGVILRWESNIGFGEYTLYFENGEWHGDSECMDSTEDKWFLKKLLDNFIEKLKVEE